jgi:PKD repeat protein
MGSPLGTAPDGALHNQVLNGHLYWYEQVWSNKGHRCRQRLDSRLPEPVAAFTSTPATGLTVHFDASASSAPGGIAEYAWEFSFAPYSLHREVSQETTVRTTSPTVSHTFKKAGRFPVALTVFSPNGASLGTAQTVAVH